MMLRLNRIKFTIVLCGFILFIATNTFAQTFTILSHAETDPYTDSRAGKALPDKVELFFFYEEDCELCNELGKFYDILSKDLPREVRDRYPHLIYTINTLSAEGRKTYEQLTNAMGLDSSLLWPPLMIAGGRVFQGYETIANNIEEAFLTAGEDIFVNHSFYNPALKKTGSQLFDGYSLNPGHVTAVYFYRIVCPDCKQITPLISALPETAVLNGRQVSLDIIKMNTRSGNNNERIAAFFDKYQVPDEDRQVPIVFFSDGYLSGVEAIKDGLMEKLAAPFSTNKIAELIHQ